MKLEDREFEAAELGDRAVDPDISARCPDGAVECLSDYSVVVICRIISLFDF